MQALDMYPELFDREWGKDLADAYSTMERLIVYAREMDIGDCPDAYETNKIAHEISMGRPQTEINLNSARLDPLDRALIDFGALLRRLYSITPEEVAVAMDNGLQNGSHDWLVRLVMDA